MKFVLLSILAALSLCGCSTVGQAVGVVTRPVGALLSTAHGTGSRIDQLANHRPALMTAAALKESAVAGSDPPAELTPELRALWLTKADRWEDAHNVAQDIHTPDGSWIHALLHLIEGDIGNAGYWYARAGRPGATTGGD